jgi:methylamine---glutamate N-methyltransferase subunit C
MGFSSRVCGLALIIPLLETSESFDIHYLRGNVMAKPIVAANEPKVVRLERGKEYYFCRCGRSREQPFCDGSHEGTGIEPMAFTARKSGDAWLCMCKQSKGLPFCDGLHAQVPDSAVGTEFDLTEQNA